MATEQVLHAGAIRDLTADEVARYRENGWVKLERLIDPDLAAEMLAAAKAVRGAAGRSSMPTTGRTTTSSPATTSASRCARSCSAAISGATRSG
jgi:hypothetical protein